MVSAQQNRRILFHPYYLCLLILDSIDSLDSSRANSKRD